MIKSSSAMSLRWCPQSLLIILGFNYKVSCEATKHQESSCFDILHFWYWALWSVYAPNYVIWNSNPTFKLCYAIIYEQDQWKTWLNLKICCENYMLLIPIFPNYRFIILLDFSIMFIRFNRK